MKDKEEPVFKARGSDLTMIGNKFITGGRPGMDLGKTQRAALVGNEVDATPPAPAPKALPFWKQLWVQVLGGLIVAGIVGAFGLWLSM